MDGCEVSLSIRVFDDLKIESLTFAGRGDLEDEKVKKEYERGYKVLLDFYHQHL